MPCTITSRNQASGYCGKTFGPHPGEGRAGLARCADHRVGHAACGHVALIVPSVYAACEGIKAAGGNVTRDAGAVKGGSTVIAFVTDPDGYKIELIQRAETAGGAGLR